MAKFIPKRQDKDVISIRIPTVVLEEIDMRSAAYDLSRNQFINQCILYALENMDDSEE